MLGRLLRDHLAPYRRWLGTIVVLQFGATVAMLFLPSLNARIIDDGVARGEVDVVLRLGVVMLLVTLGQAVGQMTAAYFAGRTSMSLGRDLRAAIFKRVGGFSSREVAHYGAPTLITRATNDVQQVQMLAMMTCIMAVMVPIMMIGGIVMAVREDAGLSWLIVATVPVLFACLAVVVSRMVPAFRAMQVHLDSANRVLREQLSGIRVVRAFVREPLERARFEQANADLTRVSLTAGRWMAAMFPLALVVSNIASAGVVWFGGHRVAEGSMEVGSLTAFITYLMQILMSVMMGTFMLMMVPRAAVAADRIAEVLDTETTVVPPSDPVRDVHVAGHLDLERVGLTHPGAERPVLREVTFSARPGQTVAVIGSTGAGKTTLVKLVPRLLDATEGVVRVDGVDVRDLDPELLWSRIGLVPQRAYLFSGTVAENLRHGRADASEEELWQALGVAQARDFVAALPDGLDTVLSQGGTTVSGGQRQRLAIARALVRRPEIYLFDDAFSALDLTTDARLRSALRPATRDAVVVIVAQRIATIRDADHIVVLEDGEVVGRGRHAELLADNPTYREIAASQGFEDAA